jgi:purine-binding chemotaxis protein CheW
MSDKKEINWKDIYKKLDKLHGLIENDFLPDVNTRKKILKKRAKLVARELITENFSDNCLDIVEFMLLPERYAIEAVYIQEIYPLKEITPIPCTPHFILGVINLRREILSVIDLKKMFGLPEKVITNLSKVIVIQINEMKIGILADSIEGVRTVFSEKIQPPPMNLTGIQKEYIKGVIFNVKEPVILLNIWNILSDNSIIIYEEVN